MAEPKRATRRKATPPRPTTPTAPRQTGPSEAEQILMALALQAGGEVLVTWDAWGQAIGRPDVDGYKLTRTKAGVAVQATYVPDVDLGDDDYDDSPMLAQVAGDGTTVHESSHELFDAERFPERSPAWS